jgi:hypothetical protein
MRHGFTLKWTRFDLLWDGLILGLLIGVFGGAWMQENGWINGLTGWTVPSIIVLIGIIPRAIVEIVRGMRTFRAARDHQPHEL